MGSIMFRIKFNYHKESDYVGNKSPAGNIGRV